MRRSGLAVVFALGLTLAPLAAEAQTKVYRIGFLGQGSGPAPAFLTGLRDFGYVEGQNIIIEYRWAQGKYERLADLAAELVRLRVDVLVTGGTAGVRAAKQATTTIPIVMTTSGDAVPAASSPVLRGQVGTLLGQPSLSRN